MSLFDRLFPPERITLPGGRTVSRPRSRLPLILVLVAVGTALSVHMTGFRFSVLVTRSGEFFHILREMLPPNVGYITRIWGPLFDTIKMSLLGSAVGSVLAVPIAVIAASNIMSSALARTLARVFLSIVRTLPTLVTALVATYIFGLGTMAGTVSIAIFTFAYVGKQLFEQIETVDMGAFEAIEAMGARRVFAFGYAITPQVLPAYLATCLFCFEGNVRYAAILGYVGAGGIGLILNEKIGWRDYPSTGMILLALLVTVVIIEWVSHTIRVKLT